MINRPIEIAMDDHITTPASAIKRHDPTCQYSTDMLKIHMKVSFTSDSLNVSLEEMAPNDRGPVMATLTPRGFPRSSRVAARSLIFFTYRSVGSPSLNCQLVWKTTVRPSLERKGFRRGLHDLHHAVMDTGLGTLQSDLHVLLHLTASAAAVGLSQLPITSGASKRSSSISAATSLSAAWANGSSTVASHLLQLTKITSWYSKAFSGNFRSMNSSALPLCVCFPGVNCVDTPARTFSERGMQARVNSSQAANTRRLHLSNQCV
mmetsp:Transcript_60736/g.162569  ORF Transcript_60736/g.162569 Transcript_60736/m.162569 type:complete len:263 (+) Transcript_60736:1841-2629(+)